MAKFKMTFTDNEKAAILEFFKARIFHIKACNGDPMNVPLEERRRLTLSLEDAARQISRRYRIGGLNKLFTLAEQFERLAKIDEFIASIPAPQPKVAP